MLSRILRRWFDSRRTKIRQATRRRRLFLEPLENRSLLATFLVTNTDDGGPGSLRRALFDAEFTLNDGGPDRIEFNISASDPGHVYYRDDGVAGHLTQANVTATAAADDNAIADIDPDWAHSWYTIHPSDTLGLSQRNLPEIIDPVIIDGYTQPGASPNTLAVGDDAVLKIEINGSLLLGTTLFNFSGDNSTVRGLAITHVPDAALSLGHFGSLPANHTTIVGNFFSTDAGGLTYQGGDGPAISIVSGSGNHIGGPAPADRNVIAPGRFVPTATITMMTGSGNLIQGNYIGVNKDGDAPLQSPFGGFAIDVHEDNAGFNIIGGTTPGAGNVIFATTTVIKLSEHTLGHNVIQGNFIGTNAIGTAGLGGGQFGLDVQSSSDTITGNVISGFSTGISINHQGPPGPGPTIQGNKIGTDVTGTLAIPNSGDGIFILGSAGGATIGGTNPGDGNTIAFNGRYGVYINTGDGCSILGNSIFANGSLGISLTGNSNIPMVNDPGDGDTGANGWQNYPVLTSVATNNGTTTVIGSLNSTPNTTFRIEFFANDGADPTGFGEGQTWMEAISVTTDANGDASFTVNLDVTVGVGDFVTATATDPGGNTSEFAAVVTVTGTNNAPPVINSLDGPTSGFTGDQLSYTGDFNDPDPDTWTGTVNYSDGSGDQPLALNPDKTFAFNHVFSSPGTYSVTVTIADNHGSLDSDSLTVTVTTNTPPVITRFDGHETGLVGQTLGYGFDFSDPDADIWTATFNWGDGTSEQDSVSHAASGIYLKTYSSPGIYTIVLTVADNHGNSDTRSVTTTITDSHPPVITRFDGHETGLVGQTLGYGFDFSDPDADTWTATFNWGDGTSEQDSVSHAASGIYLKTYSSPGIYTIVLTVADNHGNSDTRSMTTTITGNSPPNAVADSAALTTSTSRTINVLANDSDPNGDPLTVTAVTQPASGHGTVTINANGTLTFTQTIFVNGTETFTYTISDGHGGTATATVTVTVRLPARIGIDMLRSQVQHAGLRRGLQISLDSTLRAAQQALARGNSRAAANLLGAFANEVRALKRAHLLPPSLADLWLWEDANILANLNRR